MTEHTIVVVDHEPKWRAVTVEVRNLERVVPSKVAKKWGKVRRDMTYGLRRRIDEARN